VEFKTIYVEFRNLVLVCLWKRHNFQQGYVCRKKHLLLRKNL